jgi:hypothetical protein
MKNRKINLDRPTPSKEYIESKQDFNEVLKGYKFMSKSFWKNPWFYGPVGVASLAFFITLGVVASEDRLSDEIAANSDTPSELPADTECIKAPLVNQNLPFETYHVKPDQAHEIVLESGTKINFPKGSLLPKQLNETVLISIREFKTMEEAILAGVPMDYKKNEAFESAGMIEIRGTQNGELVSLNDDIPYEVEMNLITNPDGFGFWYLNEATSEWTNYDAAYVNNQKAVSVSTDVLKARISQLEKDLVVEKKKIEALVQPKVETYHLPKIGGQIFDLDFNINEYPELKALKGVQFEVNTNDKYDKNFTKKIWESVNLEKNGVNYIAVFTAGKARLELPVRPIVTGIEKEKAQDKFDQMYRSYQEEKTSCQNNINTIEKRLEYNQKLFNSQAAVYEADKNSKKLSVSSLDEKNIMIDNALYSAKFSAKYWGLFNCDNPSPYPKPSGRNLAFTSNTPIDIQTIYVLDNKKNTRFTYGEFENHKLTEFGIYQHKMNTLYIVDKRGKLFVKSSFDLSKQKNDLIDMEEIPLDSLSYGELIQIMNENMVL